MQIFKGNKTAILFGATGLVGSRCLKSLVESESYSKIILFGRKKVATESQKVTQHIVNFEDVKNWAHLIKGDDLFYCLGTTMRKAGNKNEFYKIDYTYSTEIAKAACKNNVKQYLLVSSVGANANSAFFYSQVKGELEDAVRELPFWAIHIFQPSVLLGSRNENRFGEQIAGIIGRGLDSILGGMLSKYKPIEAEYVAQAMINTAQGLRAGAYTYSSGQLQALAEEIEKFGN
jgi:uncharacterized protein YbjT (DUF2867 family)